MGGKGIPTHTDVRGEGTSILESSWRELVNTAIFNHNSECHTTGEPEQRGPWFESLDHSKQSKC